LTLYKDRQHCYDCYRPQSSCICCAIKQLPTNATFVILMHKKEYRKTKNGTGHMTHLSLPNSHLFIGIDFSEHEALNALLKDQSVQPYLLYPTTDALNLSQDVLKVKEGKRLLFILIDSTWPCSKKIIRLSKNLQKIPTVSFDTTQRSNFAIKTQPQDYCLSTIETTHTILQLLHDQGSECISDHAIKTFLKPFEAMVHYQLESAKSSNIRYKPPSK